MLYLHRITCQNDPIQWILNNLNADLILGIGFIPKTSCLYAKMAIHFQLLIAIQPRLSNALPVVKNYWKSSPPMEPVPF